MKKIVVDGVLCDSIVHVANGDMKQIVLVTSIYFFNDSDFDIAVVDMWLSKRVIEVQTTRGYISKKRWWQFWK